MFNVKNTILFTLFAANLIDQPTPVVKIEQGFLTGKISPDGKVLEYTGIPYATTRGRFQAPLPPPSWQGVYKAVSNHYVCPQFIEIGYIGTEDCLRANVYVPSEAQKPIPVMVYIHGGAFTIGSGGKMMAGPDFLVKHDVILVTINYRLGALGFLCLGIEEAPGNAGLKDQIAALKWVKRNIAAFGGDPDNVTLFGHSAGSVSTSLLLASDVTTGLFNRAIALSGSSLAFMTSLDGCKIASSVAKSLGYDSNDPKDLYDFFSNVPLKDLISYATPSYDSALQMIRSDFLFSPCIENSIPGVEAVYTELPYDIVARNPKNISVIYGITDREGYYLRALESKETLKGFNQELYHFPDMEFASKIEAKSVEKRVREIYFGDKEVSAATIVNLEQLYGDIVFDVSVVLESNIMVSKIDAPIYNYYFTYSGGRNLVKLFYSRDWDEPGASHGDELVYLFSSFIWPFKINERDQRTIDRITKMWTNFAKYGDPTPSSDDDLMKWKPSTKEGLNFLKIDDKLELTPYPNPERYELWKDLYRRYRKKNKHAPLPAPSWKGVYKAVLEHYQCPQSVGVALIGTEDCLIINVYVPTHAQRPLPVMVYIHGGAFMVGSGGKMMAGPEFLLKHDVILVTFNYRLGALGFLCLGIEEAPGNAGLKDQIAALRWIKKNIAAFGGDPDNITIFGHSAGAVSTSILVASDATKGLFNRAIAQSGASLAFMSSLDGIATASSIAKRLGFNSEDPKELYNFLSNSPLKDLIMYASPSSDPVLQLVRSNLLVGPCVEKRFSGIEPVYTELPYDIVARSPKNISVMYGFTNREGFYLRALETEETLKEFNKKFYDFPDMQFETEAESKSVERKVKEFYFGDKEVNSGTIMNLERFSGDIFFDVSVILESELMISKIDAPIYNYYFTYSGGRNLVKTSFGKNKTEPGASHGDDILYTFTSFIWSYKVNERDQKIIDWMTKMWTNFAKYGDPTPSSDNDLPIKWKPSTKQGLNFLKIDDTMELGPAPNPERYELWKDLYQRYRKTIN